MIPNKIPIEASVVAAELATWSLLQQQKVKLQADITGVLRSSRAPNRIYLHSKKALKEMQKEESIIISSAEKRKTSIIMDTDEYQEKMTKMISDRVTRKTEQGSDQKVSSRTNQNVKHNGERGKDHTKNNIGTYTLPYKTYYGCMAP